jgi:DNA polymerase III subunit delta'
VSAVADIPTAIEAATADQPAARLALAAAVESPSHAYLFAGPTGAGKRDAARALAAELLAAGAPDPGDARRRALADPSPHPDLVWIRPVGTQHLVDEVRERVIAAAAYRPFEGERRVFVIEDADAMAEESQNALLKTLEEPAPFAHLLLISAEPAALLETVRSRCQTVRFGRLGPQQLEARLASRPDATEGEAERRAAARLAGGDTARALLLLSDEGKQLREAAIACVQAAADDELAARPWLGLLDAAGAAGERAAVEVRAAAAAITEEAQDSGSADARRRGREAEEAARRVARRVRTQVLDVALGLIAAWLRDLGAVAEGADDLVLNSDRSDELSRRAAGLDPRRARRGAEEVMDTRRRLTVNVSEELALEALCFKLLRLLRPA